MGKTITTALLFFSLQLVASAQFAYNDACAIAHSKILNLDFEPNSVPTEFQSWIEGYMLLTQAITNTNIEQLQQADYSQLIKNQKQYESDNAYYYLCISDLQLIKSFVSISNKSYWQAVSNYLAARQNANKTIGWMQKRFRMFQLVIDAQLYNNFPIFAENLTTEQRITKFINLATAIESDSLVPSAFKTEIAILSVLLLPSLGAGDSTIVQLCQKNMDKCKTSAAATLAFANTLWHKGQSAEAKKLLTSALQNGFFEKANRFNLLMGCTLQNIQNDSCKIYLNRYIEKQANGGDVGYAKFKLAWHFFLQGDTATASRLCADVKQHRVITPNDAQAKYECSLYQYWDSVLIVARLHFDAGNYAACEQYLLKNRHKLKNYTNAQLNEYAYRMGRAYHKMGDLTKAKKFYEVAANQQLANLLYYPSYAFYYLGEIYKAEGNQPKADFYFQQCQKTSSPIYKESIHRKAELQMR